MRPVVLRKLANRLTDRKTERQTYKRQALRNLLGGGISEKSVCCSQCLMLSIRGTGSVGD